MIMKLIILMILIKIKRAELQLDTSKFARLIYLNDQDTLFELDFYANPSQVELNFVSGPLVLFYNSN